MEGSVQWQDRIGRRLKLRDVNILLAVVECGSMARAAERLAVSQPVVSKAIADLEHTLGVRLLDRSRKGSRADVLWPGLAQARACGVRRAKARRQGH
jgi:molybdenum-dependent DNA-binding transcriptional regulator ModE